MTPMLSIVGLLNYDETLFDGLVLPEVVDKSVLIDTIIDESAELIIRYPDPALCKRMITSWGIRRCFTWNKIAALMDLTYNPIHNYDRIETETIAATKETERTINTENEQSATREGENRNSGTILDVGMRGGTGADTGTVSMGRGTTETTSATGFNSGALQVTGTVAGSGTDTETRNLSNEFSENNNNTRNLNTVENTTYEDSTRGELKTTEGVYDENGSERQLRNYGNIGVTTTQQMMAQEMEIAKVMDLTKIIADEFVEKFCVGVY